MSHISGCPLPKQWQIRMIIIVGLLVLLTLAAGAGYLAYKMAQIDIPGWAVEQTAAESGKGDSQ